MPEMDSVALVRAIKADPLLSSVKVVLLASISAHEQAGHSHTLGIDAVLPKPVRRARLYSCLERALAFDGQSAPSRRPPGTLHSAAPVAHEAAATRVLVAADNPVNQRVVVRMLERRGYQVDSVTTGRAAVDATGRTHYALVFMDCQMPEMDGYAASAAIRARTRPGERHVVIIALTASVRAGVAEDCLAAGMDGYIEMPLTSAKLNAVLRQWAGPAPAHAVVVPPPALPPDESVFDPAVLDTVGVPAEELPAFTREIVATYLRDTSARLAALRTALLQADAPAVALTAHALKGSSATIGARELARLSAEIEEQFLDGMPPNAAQLLDSLDASFERLRQQVSSTLPS